MAITNDGFSTMLNALQSAATQMRLYNSSGTQVSDNKSPSFTVNIGTSDMTLDANVVFSLDQGDEVKSIRLYDNGGNELVDYDLNTAVSFSAGAGTYTVTSYTVDLDNQ